MRRIAAGIAAAILSFIVGTATSRLTCRKAVPQSSVVATSCARSASSGRSLWCAALRGDIGLVREQLAAGANPDETDDAGLCDGFGRRTSLTPRKITPLMTAAGLGHTEIVKLLLMHGANVNARASDGLSAISSAAYYRHDEIVDLLLARGADLNEKDSFGQTILMNAAGNGELDVVEFLLVKGARLNDQNRHGTTALMFAAGFKQADVVKLLLQRGADPGLRDHRGRKATAYEKFGYPEEYMVYMM